MPKKYECVFATFLSLAWLLVSCDVSQQAGDLTKQVQNIQESFTAVVSADLRYIGIQNETLFLFDSQTKELIAYELDGTERFRQTTAGESFDICLMDGVVAFPADVGQRVMTCDGKELPADEYTRIQWQGGVGALIPVDDEKGRWGYVDSAGHWIVKPQFYAAGDFAGSIAYAQRENDELVCVSKDGKITPACFDWPLDIQITQDFCATFLPTMPQFCEGRLLVQTGQADAIRSAFVTEDNEWLPSEFPRGKTLYTYQDAKNFSEGMAAVQVDGLWGYIHLDGTRAIQPAFQHAGSFLNGRAVVQSNEGEWHFIDPTGRKIESIMLPEGYMPTGLHSNGFLVVENEHGKNIVDQEGKLFFESEKISITRKKTPDNVPLWLVMESGFSYGGSSYFSPTCGKEFAGLTAEVYQHTITVDGTYLYALDTGELLFAAPLKNFSQGLAVASGSNRKWGYIDVSGNWVIPPVLDQAEDFVSDVAYVRMGDTAGLVLRQG